MLPKQAVRKMSHHAVARAASPLFKNSAPAYEADGIAGVPTSAGVTTMLAAFRATGGLVTGNELALMLKDLKMGDITSLGRAMASREICSFQWRSAFWIPMFQFDLDNLSFKHGLRKIFPELTPVFDEWMLAVWFVQPNTWLDGSKPVDLLASDFAAVYEAARADRYLSIG
jgi:hypothetical protein